MFWWRAFFSDEAADPSPHFDNGFGLLAGGQFCFAQVARWQIATPLELGPASCLRQLAFGGWPHHGIQLAGRLELHRRHDV
jgi:hypothetical protein